MKIFHVSQNEHNDYDTYSDFVCIAENEKIARGMYPSDSDVWFDYEKGYWVLKRSDGTIESYDVSWAWIQDISKIKVELIGNAIKGSKRGIVCSSFHAG